MPRPVRLRDWITIGMNKLFFALLIGLAAELDVSNANDPNILVIGGYVAGSKSSMELYHPLNPQLNHVTNATMAQGRWGHTSALMDDGSVITAGGADDATIFLSSCERLDPSTSEVTQCPSLNTKRYYPASSVLNGVLYVCGGYNGNRFRTCEQLLSDGWQDTVPMNIVRSNFAMVTLNGYLYAIGGYGRLEGRSDTLASVERRSASDQHWTFVHPMNTKRRYHSVAVMAGNIFVCGGNNGGSDIVSTCEKYDPIENRWVYIAQMNRERYVFALVSDGIYLFAIGGDPPLYRTVEMYESENDTWKMIEKELIRRRDYHSAVVLP